MLAKGEYADVEPRRLLPDRVEVRQAEWRLAGRADAGRDARRRREGGDSGGSDRRWARHTNPGGTVSSKEESWKDQGHHSGASEHHEGMLPVVESVDVSQREDLHKLHGGAVGLMGVLFLTVTGAAPISAMLFNTPLSVGYGNGIGTPAGFAFATLILTIFSVGYVSMARKVTAAGGFYSFISHGLGRELGMATGLLDGLGVLGVRGVAVWRLCLLRHGQARPVRIRRRSWYWLALFMVALIGDPGLLRRAHLGAHAGRRTDRRGRGTADLRRPGVWPRRREHPGRSALNPVNAFKDLPGSKDGTAAGAWAVGVFFAFWSWVGFEMAPNYGEESKDPKRIVPMAMYISVIGLGVFYTITSWAAISGYATTDAAAVQAQTDAAEFLPRPRRAVRQRAAKSAMSYLIITGSFACGMAFHNTTARYLFSLGRERVLPSGARPDASPATAARSSRRPPSR